MKKTKTIKAIDQKPPQDQAHRPVDYLTCTPGLLKLGFSETEIIQAIKAVKITLDDLAPVQEFEKIPTYRERYQVLESGVWISVKRVMDYGGKTWETWEHVQGFKVRTAGQYQGLKHGDIIRKLLEGRFNWFRDFFWDIYGFEYSKPENYEIYMRTTAQAQGKTPHLYVPVIALMQSKAESIRERMISYWTQYRTGGYTLNHQAGETEKQYKARQAEYFKMECTDTLESSEALKLFKLLDQAAKK